MICRDDGFWRPIIEHPEVKPAVSLGLDYDWLPDLLESDQVIPWRGRHGGYFLVRIDPLGRVWDLHAAFEPAGWGKDASDALKGLLRRCETWDAITVSEVDGNWRSRPPRSFGFRPAAEMRGNTRTWILTRAAWEQSPAFRRMETPCLLS